MLLRIPETNRFACGGFGKLPNQPDFIRVFASTARVAALERWVQQGILYSKHVLLSDWDAAFRSGLFHRFAFRVDNLGVILAGVIQAAVDSHGRRYPFVAFAQVPATLLDQHPLHLAIIEEELFGDLEQRVEEASLVGTLADIEEQIAQPATPNTDYAIEEGRYVNFLDEFECGDMGGMVASLSGSVVLGEAIALLRGGMSQLLRRGSAIQVPLPGSEHVRGLAIRFWLELVFILLDTFPVHLSMFWHAGTPAGVDPMLLMTFRQPVGALFAALLNQNCCGREVLQVGRLATSDTMNLPAVPYVEPGSTLRSLLDALCPGYPGSCAWYRSGSEV